MTDMMPIEDAAELAILHARVQQFMREPGPRVEFIVNDLPRYKALLEQYKGIRICNEVCMRSLEILVRDIIAGCWPRREGLWSRHRRYR
jgi:hypothetical protein